MPSLQTLPRAAVHGYLRLLRLPVDAAGRALHRDHRSPWGPSVALEAFEAKVKDVAGSLLCDEDLRQEAVVQGARVNQLRKGAENLAAAEAKQAVADRQRDERQVAAAEKDKRAESRAEDEKTRIRQGATRAKESTRRRTARQKRSTDRAQQSRKEAVAEEATTAKAETLAAERAALLERKEAAEAKAAAREIGDAAATARSRRKSASN